MWAKLGKLLGKGALWLAQHPEVLKGFMDVVKKKDPPPAPADPKPIDPGPEA
jgi:hypothetical protein